MDFLLECIGFPPDQDLAALANMAYTAGESVAWRGPTGEHLRLPIGSGLEVRLDREEGAEHWCLHPDYASSRRVRVAVERVVRIPDSPYDALLTGWANPPPSGPPDTASAESYPIAVQLTDARRLPKRLAPGHVLAISLAGFALDVSFVGDDSEASDPLICALPYGAAVQPLGGADDPGGCVQVSLRVLSVLDMHNAITKSAVQCLELGLPGRSVPFFLSPWLLGETGLKVPVAGDRIEGTFLLTGRIAGGLPGPRRRAGRTFG